MERVQIVMLKSCNRVKYEAELVKNAEKNPKIFYKNLNSQQTIRDSKSFRKQDGETTHDPRVMVEILNKIYKRPLFLKTMVRCHF